MQYRLNSWVSDTDHPQLDAIQIPIGDSRYQQRRQNQNPGHQATAIKAVCIFIIYAPQLAARLGRNVALAELRDLGLEISNLRLQPVNFHVTLLDLRLEPVHVLPGNKKTHNIGQSEDAQ
jgi:hypothetical protein